MESHAQSEPHKLAIFRGYLKFKSNKQKIWGVLIFLALITAIEVLLGIYKPAMFNAEVMGMKLLNWIFIILTIVKAYYITWDFMHMRDETASLRRMVVWTAVFLIAYLIFILLQEGGYVEHVFSTGFVKLDF